MLIAQTLRTMLINKLKHALLSPSKRLGGKTPHEVFGCEAYAKIQDDERQSKLDFKSKRCIFLGYSQNTKAYRLLDS